MLLIGCTGGIGSGKSTVAARLGARGAVVLEADRFARAAVEPGQPAYDEVVAYFGDSVLRADGGLDRQGLADIVFADPQRRRALESIVHPAVRAAIAASLEAHEGRDDVLVLESPPLVDSGDPWPYDGVIVVDVPEAVALERLVSFRHMDPDDARARMAAQADRTRRLARADFVVHNEGDLDALDAEVDRAWDWIEDLARRTR